MQFPFSRLGKFSFWNTLRDPNVRAGLYLWLLIAGLCVLIANAVARGW